MMSITPHAETLDIPTSCTSMKSITEHPKELPEHEVRRHYAEELPSMMSLAQQTDGMHCARSPSPSLLKSYATTKSTAGH